MQLAGLYRQKVRIPRKMGIAQASPEPGRFGAPLGKKGHCRIVGMTSLGPADMGADLRQFRLRRGRACSCGGKRGAQNGNLCGVVA